MKIRRAIGVSLLTYIATMIIGVIIGLIIGFENLDMTNPPLWMMIVSGATAAIFAWIMAGLYFRSPKVAKGAKYGLILGIIMILVGFILDIASWYSQYMKDGNWDGLLNYYANWCFWVALVLILLACVARGKRAAR